MNDTSHYHSDYAPGWVVFLLLVAVTWMSIWTVLELRKRPTYGHLRCSALESPFVQAHPPDGVVPRWMPIRCIGTGQ